MKQHKTFLKLFLGNLLVMMLLVAVGGAAAYHRLDAQYQRQGLAHQDQGGFTDFG